MMIIACGNGEYVFASSPTLQGCSVFPADNIWNTPVDTMPVSARSNDYITRMGANTSLHPDFGKPYMESGRLMPIGIPYTVVAGSQPKVPIQFDYASESDPGPYPIPPDAPIEGVPDWDPGYDGDRHVLVLDRDNCLLYETFYSWPNPDGSWSAGSGAIFNLNSHALRPDGWTSADAAGLPILPGLVRYNEVAAGAINHAIRFTVANTQSDYVWPARHQASSITDQRYPPLGQRFRLKASFDILGFSLPMQVILQAMKKYGIILADNGSNWYISGTADDRWDNDMLVQGFRQLSGSDFEAVDVFSLMLNPNSGQAKQVGGGLSRGIPWSILLLKNSP
jgi:hypothetical protein